MQIIYWLVEVILPETSVPEKADLIKITFN